MKKTLVLISILMFLATWCAPSSFAGCGSCGEHKGKGSGYEKKGSSRKGKSCFGDICAKAEVKGGVKEITYEQLQKIRASGEKYVLVDALSKESYDKGHIEGAISFPYNDINYKTAPKKIRSKKANIIVYCGSFKCTASTKAAHRLMALGYKNVVDYKGGLKEWKRKGNKLVK